MQERKQAHPRSTGKWGEQRAAAYLQVRGYRIIARNWSARAAEADIIAYDKRDACLVFVEVKTRASGRFGTPEESIHERKKRALERVIAAYLSERQYSGPFRVDIVAIERSVSSYRMRHLKNVRLE